MKTLVFYYLFKKQSVSEWFHKKRPTCWPFKSFDGVLLFKIKFVASVFLRVYLIHGLGIIKSAIEHDAVNFV